MNISLTPALERFVTERVESGRYQSASEVVREALRRLEQSEAGGRPTPEDLRRKVSEGLADVRAGRLFDGEEVFREIEKKLRMVPHRARRRAG